MCEKEYKKNLYCKYEKISKGVFEKSYEILNQKNKLIECISSYKYAKGGANLHRGQYCPSIILDIVVGNCSRGILVKKPSICNLYTYQYGFSNNDELIFVMCYYNGKIASEEYIFYEGNYIKGYTFTPNGELIRYSQEEYINKSIASYSYIDYQHFDSKAWNFHNEEYSLKNKKMTGTISDLHLMSNICIHETYFFDVDDAGFLRYYNVDEDNEKNKHKIKISRRIICE